MLVWKAGLVGKELGYVAKDSPSKVLKGFLGFRWETHIVKCERKEVTSLMEEPLNKKGVGLGDF